MQIHQHVAHGLLYSVAPQDMVRMRLSDQSIHDEFDWEECESGYGAESLATNVIAFFKEGAGE